MTVHKSYGWKSDNSINLFKGICVTLIFVLAHLLLQYGYQFLLPILEVLNLLTTKEINKTSQIKLHISATILDSKISLGSLHSPHFISSWVELKILLSHATAT